MHEIKIGDDVEHYMTVEEEIRELKHTIIYGSNVMQALKQEFEDHVYRINKEPETESNKQTLRFFQRSIDFLEDASGELRRAYYGNE